MNSVKLFGAIMAVMICVEAYAVNDKLIDALIITESSGRVNAIGDKGKAFGQLQIWEVVIKDVNALYKTNYSHADMFNADNSKDVCKKYLAYYGKQYKKETGKEPDNQVYARIWNGGPRGYLKKSTKNYWKKVVKYL